MYKITKQFHFSASHILLGLPDGHPCGRLHGHNYVVEIELSWRLLNEVGFVKDYGDLKVVKEFIDNHWDHQHLNDVLQANPTAENIAFILFRKCRKMGLNQMSAVRVSETPKTWAEYREG